MSTRIPLAPGTVLGRYRIAGLAGEGGMGDIYEAFDTSLERVVALKRVRSAATGDAASERFRREALALAQLNHPGICQIYELAETPQGTFIAMEWITGETLRDRLDRGPLPWREVADLLRQTAEALAPAHAKGLVHRDLKPSNLMITPEGRVKILDFGLVRFADAPSDDAQASSDDATLLDLDPDAIETQAKIHGLRASGSGRSLTRIGAFMGTLGYTSPEQSLARPVGPASDLFNLGLLAQEMLTCERAFKGEGRDALDAVVDGTREPLPRKLAPRSFRALLDRLLQREPKARPTATQAVEELNRILAPHGALWWSGLSAATVLLLGLSTYWLFGRGVIAGLVKGRPARIAVMGFKNATGVPMLTSQTELGLADLVSSRLRNEPKLQVLDSDAVARAANALKLNPAEASPDDQLRLAKAMGADLVLSGEVDRQGTHDHLTYALRDTRGRVRARGEADAKQLSETMLDAIPLAQAATHALRKAVNPFSKKEPQDPYTITPEAFAAYAQGVEAYRKGHYKEAEPLLKQAAYAVPEWPNATAVYAYTLSWLSRPESDAAFRWALVASRMNADAYNESAVTQFMARLAWIRKDYPAARSSFEQVLRSSNARGDISSCAFCLNGLGLLSEAQGDTDSAERNFKAALSLTFENADLVMRGQVLTNLGNLALHKGDLSGAALHYQAVVDAAHQCGMEGNEALGLNNLGIVLFSEFKTSQARVVLERSLALREKNGDALGVVSGLRNLGIVNLVEGKPRDARSWFSRSLDKAVAISSQWAQGQAEFYIAECDRMTGDLNLALTEYQIALDHSLAGKDTNKLGPELAGKAECLLRLHRTKAAGATLAKAAALIPKNPYLLRAQAWSALLRGDRSTAKELVDRGIQDPNHDAAEIRFELESLKSRFSL